MKFQIFPLCGSDRSGKYFSNIKNYSEKLFIKIFFLNFKRHERRDEISIKIARRKICMQMKIAEEMKNFFELLSGALAKFYFTSEGFYSLMNVIFHLLALELSQLTFSSLSFHYRTC